MAQTADPIQQALSGLVKAERKAGSLLKGLTVSQQAGKPRVRYSTPEHSKPETATLPLTWSIANVPAVIDQLQQVSRLINTGYPLRQAVDTLGTISTKKSGEYSWVNVYKAWADKQGFTVETRKKHDGWFARMHKLLRDSDYPVTNGKMLFRQYERMYFHNVKPGTDGRIRALRFFSNLIDYAVNNHGLHEDWQVTKEFRLDIVGKKESSEKGITPPILTPDLLDLLDKLENKYPDIYTMVGLMACYGLMGAELAVIKMTEQGLQTVKDRPQHMLPKKRKPRSLESIDPLVRQGLGEDIAKKWISGYLHLPTSVYNAIARIYDAPYSYESPNYKAVGDAVRQVLDRNEYWKALVRVNPDITPYSLRHSFAWRCHRELNMETSMVAPWMGHSSFVHDKHYSAFFTGETQRKYKAEMVALAQERARLVSKNDSAKSLEQED